MGSILSLLMLGTMVGGYFILAGLFIAALGLDLFFTKETEFKEPSQGSAKGRLEIKGRQDHIADVPLDKAA